MKYWKIIFVFSLINAFSITKLSAFGVDAAAAENVNVVVAENSSANDESVNSTAASSGTDMEAQHIGNAESIEAGRQTYGNTCLFCHGPKGKGARAPTLVEGGFVPGGVKSNEYFFSTVKYGKPGTIMGSFEGTLTETQMWQVIAYLRDQAKQVAANK
jgi:cytochrome c2